MRFSPPSTWWTDITPRAWQAEAMTAAVEALATAEPAIIHREPHPHGCSCEPGEYCETWSPYQ